MPVQAWALWVLTSCSIEGELRSTTDGPSVDSWSGDSNIDTDSVSVPESGIDDSALTCGDRYWPAEPQTQISAYAYPATLSASPLEWEVLWSTADHDVDMEGTSVVGPLSTGESVVTSIYSGGVGTLSALGLVGWVADSGTLDEPATPAIGDLNGDGAVDVVVPGKETTAWTGTGAILWQGTGGWPSVIGAASLADLDGDGSVEMVSASTVYSGVNGNVRGTGAYGIGSGCCDGEAAGISIVADIDLDGQQDIVVGNAVYDGDGNTVWYNGEEDGYVAVANFDDDNEAEIVVSGNGWVRLQDTDGTVLWSADYLADESGPPAIDDFNADGRPEIAVASDTTVMVIDRVGRILWSEAILEDNSGWGGVSAFDVDGDGDADVLHGDMYNVYVFDGSTGAILLDQSRVSATGTEYPTPVDLDGDGRGEIVFPSSWNGEPYPSVPGGVTALKSTAAPWGEARAIWNQHAYSITNVNDDGTIPTNPEPNWLLYNNFRSANMRVSDGYHGPDIFAQFADVCEIECTNHAVRLWIQVGNQGYGDVTQDFNVELWGVTGSGTRRLNSFVWSADIPAGSLSESNAVDLTGIDDPLLDLWVEIDGGPDSMGGVVGEADETNNVTRWGTLVCP